jgi:nucleoside 2-deoxyribosyltransferase
MRLRMPPESSSQSSFDFAQRVGAIYRTLGAKVEPEVNIGGTRIDLLVTEHNESGAPVRRAIECKALRRMPVGVDIVSSYAALFNLLKEKGLVDAAAIVSYTGFTPPARAITDQGNWGLELINFAVLQQRVEGLSPLVEQAERELAQEAQQKAKAESQPLRIFVVMPFSQQYADVYILGIREVAERLGFVVERADEIEHNFIVNEVIGKQIGQCDIVIGEVSEPNPNVYYEIGYSHALNKPTILIARAATELPFDTQQFNHIFYASIVDLRERLTKRLLATASDSTTT